MGYKMIDGRRYRTCRPSGGKLVYKTKDQAEERLTHLRTLSSLQRRESRVYSCDGCGGWHITKSRKFYPSSTSTVGKRS